MGSSTACDVVSFVVHSVISRAHNDTVWESEDAELLCGPEGYLEERDLPNESVDRHGWSFQTKKWDKIGKKKRIYASYWVKDDRKVYVLNESEYECVGECDMALIADSREDLELFLNDWNLTGEVEETDSVSQTS